MSARRPKTRVAAHPRVRVVTRTGRSGCDCPEPATIAAQGRGLFMDSPVHDCVAGGLMPLISCLKAFRSSGLTLPLRLMSTKSTSTPAVGGTVWFSTVPKPNKKRVLDLAGCQCVEQRANLVLDGAPSVVIQTQPTGGTFCVAASIFLCWSEPRTPCRFSGSRMTHPSPAQTPHA